MRFGGIFWALADAASSLARRIGTVTDPFSDLDFDTQDETTGQQHLQGSAATASSSSASVDYHNSAADDYFGFGTFVKKADGHRVLVFNHPATSVSRPLVRSAPQPPPRTIMACFGEAASLCRFGVDGYDSGSDAEKDDDNNGTDAARWCAGQISYPPVLAVPEPPVIATDRPPPPCK